MAALVAAHSFDEGSGTTLSDSSGQANHGSISGATWTSSGKFGSALSFDGIDDIVTVPHASSLALTSAMTIEAWVYPTALDGWRTVIFKNGDILAYLLYVSGQAPNPSTQVNVAGDWPEALSPSGVSLNTWSHLAATYDGSTLRLYVNATLVASTAVSGSINASVPGSLQFGGNSVWGEYFQGRIDEVRIYNEVLSAAQLATDMGAPVGGGGGGPDTQAPTAPTNLAASAISSTQINVSWSASTDNVAVTGYLLERCQGASCTNFIQIAAPTTTSFSDTALTAGSTYRYRVRAKDAVPNYSSYSTLTSATTSADTQAPTTPAGLTASAASSTQIDLSWTASTDNVAVTGYLVERCQGASCTTFTQVATPTTTSFSDTGRAAGTTYRYRVRAQDAVPNFSAYSSIVSATTTGATDSSPPTTPTNLTVTAGPNQIVLSWGASSDNVGVTAYLVERCAGSSCTYSQIASVATTAYTDTNVAVGTSYSYRVRAQDAVPNYSSYATAGSAMPADCD